MGKNGPLEVDATAEKMCFSFESSSPSYVEAPLFWPIKKTCGLCLPFDVRASGGSTHWWVGGFLVQNQDVLAKAQRLRGRPNVSQLRWRRSPEFAGRLQYVNQTNHCNWTITWHLEVVQVKQLASVRIHIRQRLPWLCCICFGCLLPICG